MNSVLGPVPRELHLYSNYLQCSGALALLRPTAGHADMQGNDKLATASRDVWNAPQPLRVSVVQLGPKLCWGHLKEGNFALQLKVTFPVF